MTALKRSLLLVPDSEPLACVLRDRIYHLYLIKTHKEVKLMFRQSTIKQPSSSLPTSLLLQNIVVDLEPQDEESISGGSNLAPYIQSDWLIAHASSSPLLNGISACPTCQGFGRWG